MKTAKIDLVKKNWCQGSKGRMVGLETIKENKTLSCLILSFGFFVVVVVAKDLYSYKRIPYALS